MKNKFYLLFTGLLMVLLFSYCEPVPKDSVIITLKEYNDLRSGSIIDTINVTDTLVIEADYDSVDNFWRGKLTSLNFAYEKTLDSLTNIKPDTVIIDKIVYLDKPVEIVEIVPIEVKVDAIGVETLVAENMIDDVPYVNKSNKGTRWAVSGYPHQAVFKFAEVVEIDSIEINTYAWDEEYTHTFKVYNFSDLLLEGKTKTVKYSGHKIKFVGTQLYLEITGGENSWTDIGEVKFYKK